MPNDVARYLEESRASSAQQCLRTTRRISEPREKKTRSRRVIQRVLGDSSRGAPTAAERQREESREGWLRLDQLVTAQCRGCCCTISVRRPVGRKTMRAARPRSNLRPGPCRLRPRRRAAWTTMTPIHYLRFIGEPIALRLPRYFFSFHIMMI